MTGSGRALVDRVRKPTGGAPLIIGFLLLAHGLVHLLYVAGAWSQVTVVAASSSLLLLVAFSDRQLWIGVLVDVLLVAAALLRPEWLDAVLPCVSPEGHLYGGSVRADGRRAC
jgi:hypothetical protein